MCLIQQKGTCLNILILRDDVTDYRKYTIYIETLSLSLRLSLSPTTLHICMNLDGFLASHKRSIVWQYETTDGLGN